MQNLTSNTMAFYGQNNFPNAAEDEDMEVDGIEVCSVCHVHFESFWSNRCSIGHGFCLQCIKNVVVVCVDTKKQLHLTCPIATCRKIIGLDNLARAVEPFTFYLLQTILSERDTRAAEEAFACVYQEIKCLRCNNTEKHMEKVEIHFKCRHCFKEFCTYCHRDWCDRRLHMECHLLNCSGTRCFQNRDVYPDNWENKPNPGAFNLVSVKLQDREGQAIISQFRQTSRDRITQIKRVENVKLWEKYALKRKHMVEEIGLSNINERTLFHGTQGRYINPISKEGFDTRVKTLNGAVFGKGNYFSTQSQYSQKYADQSNKIFIARVLCGISVLGSPNYDRPPYNLAGRMFDSCVNDENNPWIYCIFDNSQSYPAYIIEYSTI